MMRTIDPERYARVKALFGRAYALDLPARAELLDTQCKDDPELRREVEELLRHADLAGGRFLSEDPRAMLEATQPTRLTIPGYRILELIDGGGSGVVFRAEQLQPRREVALKVLRFDTLGSCQVARFRREAQLMAQFAHPGIAQVLAAGMAETDAGPLPWIAMELVRGRHLGEHLRATRLDPRGIVDLFVTLCDAVEHAHARGVVHRDLKPSNVMVDDEGRLKVLDFGIARSVVDERDTHERTRTGLVLGTLAYMPPEQARGDGAEVGPSGDVYALGVMLFEALTGALPVDIEATDVLEAVRLVCEAEPRRPRQFSPSLSADLETILLKTLEKDPLRRYACAGALGADLSNWRAGRPIVARRAGVAYRTVRFVQRHRVLTAAALVVVTALASGLGIALSGLRAEREARARTSATLEDLAAKIFDLAPQLGFGEEQRSVLDEVERRIAQQLTIDPENGALRAIRARALAELMTMDIVRGENEVAEARGHEARELLEALAREQPEELRHWTALSQVYARLGEARRGLGDAAGCQAWFQRAFELDEHLVREHPLDRELVEDLGWSISRLVDGVEAAGDFDLARRLVERRLTDAQKLYDAEPDNWKYVYNLSHAYASTSRSHRARGGLAEAKRDAEESVRLAGRLLELQRGRRDFVHWNVGASRIAMQALEALDDPRGALRYATLVLGAALDLFYGDPLRVDHSHVLREAVNDVHRIAAPLGDGDCLARVRTRIREAVEVARLAHIAPESLALLEAVLIDVGAARIEVEIPSGTRPR
jgi:tetratricopeptide (TPR) repeat protein